MGTRSFISIKDESNSKFKTIYCHMDGCLEYMGATLIEYYQTSKDIFKLLENGDLSYISEDNEIKKLRNSQPAGYYDSVDELKLVAKESFIDYVYVFENERWLAIDINANQSVFLDDYHKDENKDAGLINYVTTPDYNHFLYKKFGNVFIELERNWLLFLDRLASHNKDNDYSCFKLAVNKHDDNLFYFKLDSDKRFDCKGFVKYLRYIISADSLSLIAMIFSVSYLIEKMHHNKNEVFNLLVELKDRLIKVAEESEQSKLISDFI